MGLRDVQHDRARLEQLEIVFLIGWNFSERMQHKMRGLLHLLERHEAHVVRLPGFLQRPAHLHVAREAPALVGRIREGSDGGGHGEVPGDFLSTSKLLEYRIARSA